MLEFNGATLTALYADIDAFKIECGGAKGVLPSYNRLRLASWAARTGSSAELLGFGRLHHWLADHGLPGPKQGYVLVARSDGCWLCQAYFAVKFVKMRPFVTERRWWHTRRVSKIATLIAR